MSVAELLERGVDEPEPLGDRRRRDWIDGERSIGVAGGGGDEDAGLGVGRQADQGCGCSQRGDVVPGLAVTIAVDHEERAVDTDAAPMPVDDVFGLAESAGGPTETDAARGALQVGREHPLGQGVERGAGGDERGDIGHRREHGEVVPGHDESLT